MKRIFFPALLLLTAVGAYSATAATNKLTGAELKTLPDVTELRFTFTQPAKYKLVPDIGRQIIKVVVSGSEYNPALEFKSYGDERVRGLSFYRENHSSVAEIVLMDIKTSLYHALSDDGLELTIRLKSRGKLIALKSDVKKEEFKAGKEKRDREIREKMRAVFDESGIALYKEALLNMQKNRFGEAARKFGRFVKRYPNSIYLERAYFSRAESLYRVAKRFKEKIPEAIDAYRMAAVMFPASEHIPRARMRLGDLNFDLNMDIEALASYDSLVSEFPKSKFSLSALLGKADIYLRREQYDQAYNELERILLFFPAAKEVREARFKIGEAFYLRKRYETALQIFEDSDAKWPTFVRSNADTLAAFADSYFQLRRYDRAIELYAELANFFPESDLGRDAINRIGDIYLIRGELEPALKLFGEQARRRPDDKAGLDARLRLAAMGHSPDKIISEREAVIWTFPDYFHPMESYEDIIKNHPETVQARDAMYQKAWLLGQRKQYIESILLLKEMMAAFPRTKLLDPVLSLVKENLYKIVRSHHSQQGYYSVLRIYYENFEPFFMEVKEPDVIIKVGDAYYEMGLYDRSIEKFDQARDADKAGRFKDRVRYSKGRSYVAQRKFAQAVEMLEPFSDILDNSAFAPDAMHLLGDVYNEQADKAAAIKSYMRAMAIDPEHERVSETAYNLGILFKEDGRYRQAVNFFNMAINRYRPVGERPDPFHVQESYYQLIEANYRDERFDDAINFADHAVKRYPEHKQVTWALYVKSASETKLSEDEKAAESLKELAKKEPATIYGKVANATVQIADWKLKYRELFN